MRITVWTMCCLVLIMLAYVLVQRPNGLSAAVYLAVNVDTFIAAIGLFMCVITACIVDLWYKARFG